MIKLVVKHVNDHLNEKYTWPEKIILIISKMILYKIYQKLTGN